MAEEKKGLFGSKSPTNIPSESSSVREDVSNMSRRLRLVEEQLSTLRQKDQLIEQNLLVGLKKSSNEVKLMDSDLADVKDKIRKVEEKIILLIKELRMTGKKEDVDVIKKYLALWDPVKFVTVDQVEKMVHEALEDHEHGPEHEQEKSSFTPKKIMFQ